MRHAVAGLAFARLRSTELVDRIAYSLEDRHAAARRSPTVASDGHRARLGVVLVGRRDSRAVAFRKTYREGRSAARARLRRHHADHAQRATRSATTSTTSRRRFGTTCDKVNATIDDANAARPASAMTLTEQRVSELQRAARGRAGGGGGPVRRRRRRPCAEFARRGGVSARGGMELASDELDAADEADDTSTQEEGDGDDSSTESTAQALPAAPRVRPRSRTTAGMSSEYDLLTAALIGATIGAVSPCMLRRGPSGSASVGAGDARPRSRSELGWTRARPSSASKRRRWAARSRRRAVGPDSARRHSRARFGLHGTRAREAIDDAVASELDDLRRAVRRQRKRLGI